MGVDGLQVTKIEPLIQKSEIRLYLNSINQMLLAMSLDSNISAFY